MKKIFVGMSGGVDSSVAAALLQRDGYEVTGVYMKNWTQDVGGIECSWQQDLSDAQSVAARLDIPFEIFDFETEYRERVVEYMVAEYEAGLTPNPDIMCNQEVKFKLFLETALARGADGIATGHYARTRNGQLYAGVDESKDQSYFLYRVSMAALRQSLFPLGEMQKSEVRRLAAELELATAAKPDSQGICFIGEVSIKEFLQQYIDTTPGPIKHIDGRVLGQHEGAALYTIGQRHGLDVGGALLDAKLGGGLPLYVVSKDMASNTVYVTENLTALMQDELTIDNLHWIDTIPQPDHPYLVRTRHRGQLIPSHFTDLAKARAQLKLSEPERALTAGQSAVIYTETDQGLKVIGGGVIAALSG
ncbi:MAG: tRNA 2-thiouridine(34) synthase MnmA [Candidatus Saccharimonadales bacterium]